MRNLKIIATSAAIIAALYTLLGVISLVVTYYDTFSSMDKAQIMAQGIWYKTWRTRVLEGSIISVFLGIAACSAAIGLMKKKEWARRLWLATSTLITLFQINSVAMNAYLLRHSEIYETGLLDWTILLVLILTSVISWIYFTRTYIKEIFMEAT